MGNDTLGITGVVLGGVSLVGIFLLSVVIWFLWSQLRKLRGELLSCKYQLDKFESQPGKVLDPNLIPLAPLDGDGRPTSPASNPRPIISDNIPGAGYSSVNVLSLLPDAARTIENLEGETISTGNDQEQLLDKFRKERQEYEENQLQLCEGMRANRGGGPAAGNIGERPVVENQTTSSRPKSEPMVEKPGLYNYDVIELPENRERHIVVKDGDEYGEPVDAIQQPVKARPAGAVPSSLMPLPSDGQQKNVLNVTAAGQAYTPVFNPQLQQDRGDLREHRTMSELSPRHGYENSDVVPEKPLRKNSVENVKVAAESVKPVAAPSNSRRMAKEKVEIDPERQRMFRVTSKKERSKSGMKAGDHTDDSGISSDASPVVGVDTAEAKNVTTAPQSKPIAPQEYAMVNISDKKKNRIGKDIAKCEGSGAPQHFVAPPVLSS